MLVVSAFALLFIALVIGLSAVSIREQKQSGDTDMTNRAILLAESGIADAFSTLENNPAYREKVCTQKLDGDGNGWTCRTITTTPGEPEGSLERDESDLIRADKAEFENPDGTKTPVRYSTNLVVNYCNEADVKAGIDCDLSDGNPFSTTNPYPTYPPVVKAPAVLELSFIHWKAASTDPDPSGGNNDVNQPGDIKVKTYLVDPAMADQSPLHGAPKITSTCSSTPNPSGYYCQTSDIDIGTQLGGAAKDYRTVVKLKSRYNSSHYKMTFTNSGMNTYFGKPSNSPVPVPATNFLIDVTAKSGNVYRRTIARRKIEQTVSEGVFDNALFAVSSICKNMTVKNDLSLNAANSCG